MYATPKVLKFNGPFKDSRRYSRGTYLFLLLFLLESDPCKREGHGWELLLLRVYWKDELLVEGAHVGLPRGNQMRASTFSTYPLDQIMYPVISQNLCGIEVESDVVCSLNLLKFHLFLLFSGPVLSHLLDYYNLDDRQITNIIEEKELRIAYT
jgi:hypothetical protein